MSGLVWLLNCLCGILLTGNVLFAYDNIALNKPAWQQYPYSPTRWGADKAVDGLYSIRSAAGGQCTISDNNKRTATWWVNLGSVLSIYHITIYTRTDDLVWDAGNGYTSRFLGFSVYISNTTNKDEGFLCFKDTVYTTATIPNTTTITCIQHGQYVIYYNERLSGVTYPSYYSPFAHLELCELEVYGCPTSGVYGENCNIPCPQNCQEGHCSIVYGTCVGCVEGYRGSRCEQECDSGFYGADCSLSCGSCLNFEQCHHINGTCLQGCDRGFQGHTCTNECPTGLYGYNCIETCNVNCGVPGRCDRKTGECQGGCQAGWKGTKCDNKCDGGKFGLNCAQSCGVCLDKEQCHHINGSCLNGCDRGYQGINCTQECTWGFHGYGCNETCSTGCFNGTCDAMTGACPQVAPPPDSQEINTVPIIGGAVAVIVVSLAVVTLVFLFRRNITNGTGKEQNDKEKRAEQLSSENTIPYMDIYDKISENGPYQELGPRTDESDNGEYQGLGPRTEESGNGGYQELGPRTEVSDNGEYQGLGPRIKDKSKDNGDYQELGQISQPSHYDKLH